MTSPTRPLRVLHVLDHSIPLQSGYAFRTLAILEQQRAFGWETYHLTSPKHTRPYVAEETVDGWPFYRTPPAKGPLARLPVAGELLLMRAIAKRLREVAESVRPDIIHAHSPVLNALPAITVGKALRTPVAYEVRALWEDGAVSHGVSREGDLRYRATRWLETRALRRAGAVTTICDGLRQEIRKRGVPDDRIFVVSNAVEPALLKGGAAGKDEALAERLGLSGKTVLGFLGSFYSYEGLHFLIDTMPAILAQQPDLKLLLVGGGPEDANLRQQVTRLGLEDDVIFAGRVPHDQVEHYYDLFDILIFPRLRNRVTELVTPLKPLEAMAQEKIIIASDVGGHRELIEDGVTGTLFRADDADDLTNAVMAVLANRDNWPRQRAVARRFVEEQRSWPKIAEKYKLVYGRLLGRSL